MLRELLGYPKNPDQYWWRKNTSENIPNCLNLEISMWTITSLIQTRESHSTRCFSLLLSPPMPTSLPPPATQPSENRPFRGRLPGCWPPRPSVKVLYAIWVRFPGASENRYNDSGIHKPLLSAPLLDLSRKVSCPGLHAEESPTYHKHTHNVIWSTWVPLCWNLLLNCGNMQILTLNIHASKWHGSGPGEMFLLICFPIWYW